MTFVRPIRSAVRLAAGADAIVVGSGMAGLVAALGLAPRRVTVLTKTPALASGSTAWAQGGIAAALGAGDSPAAHAGDTIAAGAGLSDAAVVELLTREGAARIAEMAAAGAPFDRDAAGAPLLGREAAHAHRRIVHAGGDATGRHVQRWLAEAVAAAPSIAVETSAFAWDLIVGDGRVRGVLAYHEQGGWTAHLAPFVVLAMGGAGQLFERTTNPREATADGVAMAARAGARLAELEFVQFHPTALAGGRRAPGEPMPLLTEALRGEGATLLDGDGRRFMADEHPAGELAPRDVVARAIWRRVSRGDGAFLDMRAVMAGAAADRFPTVRALCAAAGFDPARAPVPVAPAAHYHMGGVAADADGRTSLDGLWVCGEVAASGVHGANRLASNSLLEAVVFGRRVAEDIVRSVAPAATAAATPAPRVPGRAAGLDIAVSTARLRRLMYDHVGLQRSADGLERALDAHRALARRLDIEEQTAAPAHPAPADVRRWGELRNLALVGHLVTLAAWRRRESRGAHYRDDFPHPASAVGRRRFTAIDDLRAPAAAGAAQGGCADGTIDTAAALSA